MRLCKLKIMMQERMICAFEVKYKVMKNHREIWG